MKYVVYRDGEIEHMVIFPSAINHNYMANAMDYLRFDGSAGWHRNRGEVVSAGFIDGGECHGRSESLDMNSRKVIDTALFKAGCMAKASPGTPPGN